MKKRVYYTSFGKNEEVIESLDTSDGTTYVIAKEGRQRGSLADCFYVMARLVRVADRKAIGIDKKVGRGKKDIKSTDTTVITSDRQSTVRVAIHDKLLHDAIFYCDYGNVVHIVVKEEGNQATIVRMWKEGKVLNIMLGRGTTVLTILPADIISKGAA
jgi:hypothetical protein